MNLQPLSSVRHLARELRFASRLVAPLTSSQVWWGFLDFREKHGVAVGNNTTWTGPQPFPYEWPLYRRIIGRSTSDAAYLRFLSSNLLLSRAQLFQDLLVAFLLQEKRGGYFVELGATNGISLSNTYLLETQYGWYGILAEPAVVWHDALRKNRSCSIDTRCVWSSTGQTLKFAQTGAAELSTIAEFISSDDHASARKECVVRFSVQAVSLNQLLLDNNAPHTVDYLSIDTEGSEWDILAAFDFSGYRIRVITVEHNYVEEKREKIATLLRAHGYARIFPAFSLWDDWYVDPELASRMGADSRST